MRRSIHQRPTHEPRVRTALPALVAALTAAAALSGCVDGRDPPPLHVTLPISGGPFTLGAGSQAKLACGDSNTPLEDHCDSGKGREPKLWIDDITFAPGALVNVTGFTIQTREVTNEQYEFCVESGACTPPAETHIGDQRYYGAAQYRNYPVVYVTKAQAAAYCKFIDGELPTEAQWEVAARRTRTEEVRKYPWAGDAALGCKSVSTSACGDATPQPVGSSSGDINDLGIQDLASNVSEWVRDGWRRWAYCDGEKPYSCHLDGIPTCTACVNDDRSKTCAKSCRESDLVLCRHGTYRFDASNTTESVIRGGSYMHSVCKLRLFDRRKEASTAAHPWLGFRCVNCRGR